MPSSLQRFIDEATDELARQTARKDSLETALKDSLSAAATSPAALVTAFSTGVLLAGSGARRKPAQSAEDAAGKGRFLQLLEQIGLAANWVSLIPVLVGVWTNTHRGSSAIGDQHAE
jgi:hypothetical protein